MFESPNLFVDHTYSLMAGATTTTLVMPDGWQYQKTANAVLTAGLTADGRPSLAISATTGTNNSANVFKRLTDLNLVAGTDKVTVVGRITGRTGTANANTAVFLQQYSDNGITEITGVRQTFQIPAAPLTADIAFPANFVGVSLDPTCVAIGIRIQISTSAHAFTFTDIDIHKGSSTGYRPPLKDYLSTTGSFASLAYKSRGLAQIVAAPNVFFDPDFTQILSASATQSIDAQGNKVTKPAAMTVTPTTYGGAKAITIASTSGGPAMTSRSLLSTLGLAVGDTVSFGLLVTGRVGTTVSNTEVRLRQFDDDTTGNEVTGSRVTKQIPGNITGEFIVTGSAVIAAGVQSLGLTFLVASPADGYTISHVMIAKGDSVDFRPVFEKYIAARIKQGLSGTFDINTQPNLLDNNWAVTTLLGNGTAVRAPTIFNGRAAVQVSYASVSEWSIDFPISAFTSGYASACATLCGHTTNNGYISLQTLSGVTVLNTLYLVQNVGLAAVNALPQSGSGTLSTAGADRVRIFMSANTGSGTTGNTATFQDVMVADGQNTAYRPYNGPGGTAAVGAQFILPEQMYFISGRPLPIYINQILDQRALHKDDYRVSLQCAPTALGDRPYLSNITESIRVDGADLKGATGVFTLQSPITLATQKNRTVNVKVSAATGKTGSYKINMIGDSLTNRGIAARVQAKVQASGATLALVGSFKNQDISGASRSDGREGWKWTNYTGKSMVNVNSQTLTALTSGNESTYYNAGTTDNTVNPFIRPSVGGDPAGNIYGGLIFDYANYLSRFQTVSSGALSAATPPDLVTIALGTNDLTINASTAISEFVEAAAIIIPSIRAAAPNAHIALIPPFESTAIFVNLYATMIALLKKELELYDNQIGGKIYVLPVYAHMDMDAMFQLTGTTLDSQTRTGTGTRNEPIHWGNIGKEMYAEAVAAWVMNLIT